MEVEHLHHMHCTYRLHSLEFNIVPWWFFTVVPFADVFYLERDFLTFNKKYWSKLQLMKRKNTRLTWQAFTWQQISPSTTLYIFLETCRKNQRNLHKINFQRKTSIESKGAVVIFWNSKERRKKNNPQKQYSRLTAIFLFPLSTFFHQEDFS